MSIANKRNFHNKIVFIKGGANGKGAAIYTHGEYYTTSHDVKTLVDSLNIVKGVMVNNDSSTLKVASGHNGVINFSNGDNTVAVNGGYYMGYCMECNECYTYDKEQGGKFY